jgi:branched-chain amino acid transport system substrate-binding protein
MAATGKIFISYRREDAADAAGRIRDWLVQTRRVAKEDVFMDVTGILPGADFMEVIEKKIAQCGAMIVLISPAWLNQIDTEAGKYLRAEAEAALRQAGSRKLLIIPVMVGGAAMPSAEQLPESLRALTKRSGTPVRAASFDYDMGLVRKALGIGAGIRPAWVAGVSLIVLVALGLGILSQVLGWPLQPGGSPTPTSVVPKRLVIATDFPTTGGDATAGGLASQYGVELAISENSDLGSGYILDTVQKSDVGPTGIHDPNVGAANIRQLISQPEVVALIGPFNSDVATAEIPLINAATLVMLSPSNTNPGLTKAEFADAYGIDFAALHPTGKPESYFRLLGADDVQAQAGASVAYALLHASKAYVVDDSSVYGTLVATQFARSFMAQGGTVIGTRSVNAQNSDSINSVATTIVNSNPDVVYFGGSTGGGAGALKAALGAQGSSVPMVSGERVAGDPTYLQQAGAAAGNTYATSSIPDHVALTTLHAQEFISAYTAKYSSQPGYNISVIGFAALAYDAAMIEITAIRQLIAAGKAVTRANLRDAVAQMHYDGVTGSISFDANGDNTAPAFSLYDVDSTSHTWVFSNVVSAP